MPRHWRVRLASPAAHLLAAAARSEPRRGSTGSSIVPRPLHDGHRIGLTYLPKESIVGGPPAGERPNRWIDGKADPIGSSLGGLVDVRTSGLSDYHQIDVIGWRPWGAVVAGRPRAVDKKHVNAIDVGELLGNHPVRTERADNKARQRLDQSIGLVDLQEASAT